jgi:hypothetical protein
VKAHRWALSARAALEVAERQLPHGGDTFEEWMAVAAAALERFRETTEAPIKEDQ